MKFYEKKIEREIFEKYPSKAIYKIDNSSPFFY